VDAAGRHDDSDAKRNEYDTDDDSAGVNDAYDGINGDAFNVVAVVAGEDGGAANRF
jgi:hypothetical protein